MVCFEQVPLVCWYATTSDACLGYVSTDINDWQVVVIPIGESQRWTGLPSDSTMSLAGSWCLVSS